MSHTSHAVLLLLLVAATSAGMAAPEKHKLKVAVPAPAAAVIPVPNPDEAFFERCPLGADWVKFRGSCYRYYRDSRYWLEAESACKNLSGHLVSIGDAAENSFLGKLTYCREAWIGRYAVHADQLNDPSNYRWTDRTTSGNQYHAHDFTNSPGLHHPLVSTRNLKWYNNVYHGKQAFVCEVSIPQRNYTCNCPTGWKELNGFCYFMPPVEATYIEADFYCRGRNAYVTSVHSAAELRALSLLDVESHGCVPATWIGLIKLNPCRMDFSTGTPICYRWSDRSGDYNGQLPKWQAGSPIQDQVTNCVVLQDEEMKSVPCYTRARFVCKKKVEPLATRKCQI